MTEGEERVNGKGGRALRAEREKKRHTKHYDIQNQGNEAEDTSTCAVFPGVIMGGCGEGLFRHGEAHQQQVNQE